MERLLKMIGLLIVAVSCGALLPSAAQEHCSLKVRVISPDGSGPAVPVSVREQSGRTQEKPSQNQDVDFCDLGILPVAVTVGSSGMCNQVTVRDVPVDMNETYLLTVIYPPGPCPSDAPPTSVGACRILFRVDDTHGHWIPGAQISISSPGPWSLRTDRFGRAEVHILHKELLVGTATAPGYHQAKFQWKCSWKAPAHEQQITLVKP